MDISIAVVGHESREYLDRAFSSIFSNEIMREFEVIFVDNDSGDGSAEFVESTFPSVRVIRNLRRCGFARNNNLAFSVSRGKYFFMLNPDTQLQKGAVEVMARFLDTTPRAGGCGPKLVFPDKGLQLSCRRFPTARSFLLRRTPLRLLQPEQLRDEKHLMSEFDHHSVRDVDWLLGAAFMVRRQIYSSLHGMEEKLEMYCEDIDFCRRLHGDGWGVYYVPDAVVIHEHLAETDKTFFSRRTFAHYKSMLQYIRRHGVKLA